MRWIKINNNAKNEITKSINYAKVSNIKNSENSVWEAIKYLRGYDTIEKQMYSKEKLQQMLNVYYLVGQITEEEYIELSNLLAQE